MLFTIFEVEIFARKWSMIIGRIQELRFKFIREKKFEKNMRPGKKGEKFAMVSSPGTICQPVDRNIYVGFSTHSFPAEIRIKQFVTQFISVAQLSSHSNVLGHQYFKYVIGDVQYMRC